MEDSDYNLGLHMVAAIEGGKSGEEDDGQQRQGIEDDGCNLGLQKAAVVEDDKVVRKMMDDNSESAKEHCSDTR
ncbi:hypothetical protein GW17_00038160 [Ensete ventricosum]|nr:hypothetical protein GW17_00038160 [Ensete ventricosum]